jgi:hypothetical protein
MGKIRCCYENVEMDFEHVGATQEIEACLIKTGQSMKNESVSVVSVVTAYSSAREAMAKTD